jgi:transketolase
LGAAEIAATKTALGLDPQAAFAFDPRVLADVRSALASRVTSSRSAWQAQFDGWQASEPQRSLLLGRLVSGELPTGFDSAFPRFDLGGSMSTRKASG